MWGLDYTTLKVGDEVSIARTGSWSIHSDGIYKVVKINKIKVFVQRVSDGYERVFSVKRRCEAGASDRYRSAYLESVETKRARDAQQQREREVRSAWAAVEQAGRDKNISKLRQAVADLELLIGEK